HWSRSHFSTHVKCDMLLNNMCESFNSFILACRDKPTLIMHEIVRCKLMRRIQGRRDKMKNWTKKICPKIFKKVEINKAKAGGCVTMWSVAAINYNGGLNTYFKAYENLILPMNEMELWDRTNMPPCVPPSYSKQPGKPRKTRRKEA
ncbi:PREDICTED: transposon, partial [Prunus dulcis]